jgi:hypothetical protein
MKRAAALCTILLLAPVSASELAAEVDSIEITLQQPVADGRSFGLAGSYEKLEGRAHFSLDPKDPANQKIVDLRKAPVDADGRVRFSSDLYILKPVDTKRGNGAAFVEVSNRGGKAIVRYFNRDAERSFDPTSSAAIGDGFLMQQGFTLVWVGWQFDVPDDPDLLRLDAVFTEVEPPIEGLVRADHVFAESSYVMPLSHRNHRAYPVADPSDKRNVLTVREARLGAKTTLPRDSWSFGRFENGRVFEDPTSIYLGEGFRAGKIYEAVYVAERPAVVGLGLAAIRDLASFVKYEWSTTGGVERLIGIGISQTGRFLRQYLYQDFNRDTEGRRVFDGLMVHTAGAGRGSFNIRFGQPSRDGHPFSAFFYPTDLFPFSGEMQTDPLTRIEDGLFKVTLEKGEETLPKIFFTNTGYEYWGRAASLIHTSIDGRTDLPIHPNVRIYHFSSAQHFVGRYPPEPRDTRYPSNPTNFFWALRGLLVALDQWVSEGVEPPQSRFPRLVDQTLIDPMNLEFPKIPRVDPPRKLHEAYRVNYGDRFRPEGVIDIEPPEVGEAFPVMVSKVDVDGNEVAGLRMPEIAVPLATYTPWNWRSDEIGAANELADFRGSFFPFSATRGDRQLFSDPRLSVDERYSSREAYLGLYAEAAIRLIQQRYLLAEDLPGLLEHAQSLWELVVGTVESESLVEAQN